MSDSNEPQPAACAPSITCPACGRTSYHPMDVQERYCGACHAFHTDLAYKLSLQIRANAQLLYPGREVVVLGAWTLTAVAVDGIKVFELSGVSALQRVVEVFDGLSRPLRVQAGD